MKLWPLLVISALLFSAAACADKEPIEPDDAGAETSTAATPGVARTAPAGGSMLDPVIGTGSTHYVATDGSDDAAGTEDDPWRTIQHAANSVEPGDVIIVAEGTYAGARIERSGTAEAWIALRAAPGARVVIDGPGPDNAHDSNLEFETWEGEEIVAYWVIEGLEVTGAPSWGIDMRGNPERHSHHFVVRGNLVHDNGIESGRSGIFTAFVDDVLVEGNESFANGEHGVYLSNSGDRFTVYGNVLHDNVFCGLHMNGDESQGGDGVISEGLVEANVIYENGAEGCSAINMDGVSNTIVRNNLLYQNHAGGISLFQENGAICSRDNLVANNTILMAEDGRWAINLSDTTCTGNRLLNNVILTLHEWRGSILVPEPGIEGFESDYNVVMDRFSADDDNSVISLSEWQDLGYGANSVVATPDEVFADPAASDFRPLPGAPAIDAGVELDGLTEDIAGVTRPQGQGVDIGAHEADGSEGDTPSATATAASTLEATGDFEPEGVVTFGLEGRIYRIDVAGGEPEDIGEALDALSPGGGDEALNVSPDGQWLVLVTERFDPECADWACLALVAGDLSEGDVVRAGGELVHPSGFAAVASGGELIVYPEGGGPHEFDLWAIRRDGTSWSAPELLTAGSPYAWNDQPAISDDGDRVVFNCGDEPYGAAGTAICEVGTAGEDLRVVVAPEDGPGAGPDAALHHPDYAPDGSIVFEADWDGEYMWRVSDAGIEPVGPEYPNDNSPCVLPDGSIATLWLGREGGSGHELKVMSPDSRDHILLVTADVEDTGIGCGAAP